MIAQYVPRPLLYAVAMSLYQITLVSDNGPQYTSQEMEDFAREYNFVPSQAARTTSKVTD